MRERVQSTLTVLRGEDETFRKLYADHVRLVRGVLFNMAGDRYLDDLTQEVFIKIWRALGEFEHRSSLRTWIYRLTVNTALDLLRKGHQWQWLQLETVMLTTPDASTELENRSTVQMALGQLDGAHRSVMVLHYFEMLSLEEISEVLEVPAGTVKSRLHNGREKMKAALKSMGVDDE